MSTYVNENALIVYSAPINTTSSTFNVLANETLQIPTVSCLMRQKLLTCDQTSFSRHPSQDTRMKLLQAKEFIGAEQWTYVDTDCVIGWDDQHIPLLLSVTALTTVNRKLERKKSTFLFAVGQNVRVCDEQGLESLQSKGSHTNLL